jgi:hypothetical protein
MPSPTFKISDVFLVNEVSASDMGVHYEREVLSEQLIGEREEKLFKTLRVFENKPEALRAKAVYEQARTRLRKLCSKTLIGLVCPASQEADLYSLIDEIDALIADANRSFRTCKVEYSVIPIHIEHDNARAHEALKREIQRYAEHLVEAARTHDADAIARALRAGKGLETLVADAGLRESLEQMNAAAHAAASVVRKSIKEHEGDAEAARASAPVRAAAEAVARRFPWAAAFDVAGGIEAAA